MPEIPLDELQEKVGKSEVTVEGFTIEAGKVEEFARAVKSDDPVHRDEATARDEGYDDIPVPLTFERTSSFPRYCPPELVDEPRRGMAVGFKREYTVHGEQAYEYEQPVQVGDTLTGTTTLVDVYQREGSRGGTMTFAELETEYENQDGEVVMRAQSTRIETEGAIDDSGGDA